MTTNAGGRRWVYSQRRLAELDELIEVTEKRIRTLRADRGPNTGLMVPLKADLPEWDALWAEWDRLKLERQRCTFALGNRRHKANRTH